MKRAKPKKARGPITAPLPKPKEYQMTDTLPEGPPLDPDNPPPPPPPPTKGNANAQDNQENVGSDQSEGQTASPSSTEAPNE